MYCFCDDSGQESEASNKVIVMAGYLFPEHETLTSFESLWKGELFREGLSWLHMKDFMASQGEYAKYEDDWPRKLAVLAKFVNIIKISRPVGIGIGVDADAWRSIPEGIRKAEGDAQSFCFSRMMRYVVERMMVVAPNNTAALNFDCDINTASARFRRFIDIRERVPAAKRYLEAFTIAEPKRYVHLQAADFLAWETRKQIERQMKNLPARPDFDLFFTQVFDLVPEYIGENWTKEMLDDWIVKPFRATGQYEHF